MLQSTHIAMTKAVVEALGWLGDCNLVARNAAYPDIARVIEVEKYGAHVIGKNLASLTHFDDYCWKMDKSVPHIDISNVKVIAKPEEWGWPIIDHPDLLKEEPFFKLVNTLTTTHSNLQADEITYTRAPIMGEWVADCYLVLAKRLIGEERQKALDTLAGWLWHLLVQDEVVPHHKMNILLDGHTAFEGDMDDLYKKMEGNGTIAELMKTLLKTPMIRMVDGVEARILAENIMDRSEVSLRKLGWYRCFWRRGWNNLVRTSVLRGLTNSVLLGKMLMP